MRSVSERGVTASIFTRVLDVLSVTPSGLFLDIDGTISAIAATPEEAFVDDAAKGILRRLVDIISVVGVISGRAAADGAAMTQIDGLMVVGNHGMESLVNGRRWAHPAALANRAAIATALEEIEGQALALGFGGEIVFEDKGLSASIHYRLSDDPVKVRELLLKVVGQVADEAGLDVTEGLFVIELRPRIKVNKGTALVHLVEAHHLRGIAYFGDDVTDIDAFAAITTLRESRDLAAVSVAVLSEETHPTVASAADVVVEGVGGCVALLEAIAEELERQAKQERS